MNFAAFFSYVFLTTITPGPNNITAMSNASKYGFKKGFLFNIGVLGGGLVVLGCCAAFSALLFSYIPQIEPVLVYIGADWLCAEPAYSTTPSTSAQRDGLLQQLPYRPVRASHERISLLGREVFHEK